MKIYSISFGNKYPAATARKLVPRSEFPYKTLKLTEADKAEIAELKQKLEQLELEHHSTETYIKLAKRVTPAQLNRLYFLESCVCSLREQIRQVKINRFRQQNSIKV